MAVYIGPDAPSITELSGDTTVNPYGGSSGRDALRDAIRGYYRTYLGREASDAEAEAWLGSGQGLTAIEAAIKNSPEAQQRATAGTDGAAGAGAGGTALGPGMTRDQVRAYVESIYAQKGVQPNATDIDYWTSKYFDPEFNGDYQYWNDRLVNANESFGYHGTGAGSASLAVDPSYLAPFNGTFADTWQALYGTPFDAASVRARFQAPGDFAASDATALADDPGFQFRRSQAMGALQNTAAAQGLLNSGGTLYHLLGLADNMASQEYANAWDRNFSKWNADWTHALGAFGANQDVSDDDYNRAWQQYVENKDTWFRNQSEPFDKLYKSASLALNASL